MPGYKETYLYDEQAAIDHVVEAVSKLMHTHSATTRPMLRGQHAKAHGTVHARVTVDGDIPRDLRHGVFRVPRTYDAWVRFSASSMVPGSDAGRDPRGFALKLLGVRGEKLLDDPGDRESQDFVFVNGQQFFVRNAVDYARFSDAVLRSDAARGKLGKLWATRSFFFPTPWPGSWRAHEWMILVRLLFQRVSGPLAIRYWSQTPYKLGPHTVKYSVRPRRPLKLSRAQRRAARDQAFGTQIATAVGSGETIFDLYVQRQGEGMPVDDPTVRWSERRSPPVKVATIVIPQQDCGEQARRNFGERLRFTPWHALPEHEPLGSINRVRKAVYRESSRLRDAANGVPSRTAEVQRRH